MASFVLRPIPFVLAFALGIFYVYLTAPAPKIVFKYPTPFNTDTVYTDLSGECYKFKANKVDCKSVPADKIVPQPIQR